MDNTIEIVRLLVVSSEIASLRALWSIVESNHWRVETVPNAWDAVERVQSGLPPHLLLLDMPQGEVEGLHLLRWLRRLHPELPIVVLCQPSDASRKAEAIRLGAVDLLVHPLDARQLESVLTLYLAPSSEHLRLESPQQHVEVVGPGRLFVSVSPMMQKLRAQAELLAQADVPVLILGEKGTGKETVAHLIHRLSVRSGFMLRTMVCAGLSVETANSEIFQPESPADRNPADEIARATIDRGAILLHEITDLPAHLQSQFVNWLEHELQLVGVPGERAMSRLRIFASSSADIQRAVAENKLREDLYYRLSAFTVHVPPLRRRKDDIVVLLQQMMRQMAHHYGLPAREFPASLLEDSRKYSWPGNIREMETFVKRYLLAGEGDAVLGELYFGSHNDEQFRRNTLDNDSMALDETSNQNAWRSLQSMIQSVKSEAEKNAIGLALEKTGWNRKAAARLLKVSYRTLLYKIEQYQMHASSTLLSSSDFSPSNATQLLPGTFNKYKTS